jgi:hypothetical protein
VKTCYESFSAVHAVTPFISFRCLKSKKKKKKKKNKVRIHPISGYSPYFFKFFPDGNLSIENEDMTEKMRTYGSPRYNPKHLYPKLDGYGDNGQRSLKL